MVHPFNYYVNARVIRYEVTVEYRLINKGLEF